MVRGKLVPKVQLKVSKEWPGDRRIEDMSAFFPCCPDYNLFLKSFLLPCLRASGSSRDDHGEHSKPKSEDQISILRNKRRACRRLDLIAWLTSYLNTLTSIIIHNPAM